MGLSDFLKKGTGVDYLNKENKKAASSTTTSTTTSSSPKKKSKYASTQDDKFLKSLEQNLKRINDQVEDMLEKLRVRRGL